MNEKIAYAAGFFDGEGHIRITKHSKRGSYMLNISAVQATEEPLPLFVELFGGTVSKRIVLYKGQPKQLYTWQTSSKQAEIALRMMRPFLIVKAVEADMAFEFRSTFRPQYGDRSKLPVDLTEYRKAVMHDMQAARKKKRLVSQ